MQSDPHLPLKEIARQANLDYNNAWRLRKFGYDQYYARQRKKAEYISSITKNLFSIKPIDVPAYVWRVRDERLSGYAARTPFEVWMGDPPRGYTALDFRDENVPYWFNVPDGPADIEETDQ